MDWAHPCLGPSAALLKAVTRRGEGDCELALAASSASPASQPGKRTPARRSRDTAWVVRRPGLAGEHSERERCLGLMVWGEERAQAEERIPNQQQTRPFMGIPAMVNHCAYRSSVSDCDSCTLTKLLVDEPCVFSLSS